jgi:hypothetical protein
VEDAAAAASAAAATSTLWAAWLDASGNFLHSPYAVATASTTTWNLNAEVLPDNRVAIVYDAAYETAESELYLAITSGEDSIVNRLSEDDNHDSKYPDIAVRDDAIALTWFDVKDGNEEIYLTQFPLAQAGNIAVDPQAARVTNTVGESTGAYLAWNDAVLGLAWNDNSGGQHEILLRTFAPDLTPLAAQRQLTDTASASMIPSIEATALCFVLAWNEVEPGQGSHGGDIGATRSEVVVQSAQVCGK